MVDEEFPFGVRDHQERYGILVLISVQPSLRSVRKQITVKPLGFARVSSNVIVDANMKAPTVVVSKGPEGVVASTRYRGLQFSSLYLRQGESLPHVIGEGKESDREVLGPSRY